MIKGHDQAVLVVLAVMVPEYPARKAPLEKAVAPSMRIRTVLDTTPLASPRLILISFVTGTPAAPFSGS